MSPSAKIWSAFEDTLVSVLENQPAGSEILVAHNGSYDDPFELDGEVRFVTADSGHFLDLVSNAVHQARGRFVHILAPGRLGTCGWADAALKQFESRDVVTVAPVVRLIEKQADRLGWLGGPPRPSLPPDCKPVTRRSTAGMLPA